MKRYSLNTLILLGLISVAGIMVIQGVWVRKTMELQVKNIAIQEKEDSLNIKEFSEQCHVALRNVLEQFSDVNKLIRTPNPKVAAKPLTKLVPIINKTRQLINVVK